MDANDRLLWLRCQTARGLVVATPLQVKPDDYGGRICFSSLSFHSKSKSSACSDMPSQSLAYLDTNRQISPQFSKEIYVY